MVWNAIAFFAGVWWVETRPSLDPVWCFLAPGAAVAIAGGCAFAFRRHRAARIVALRIAILAMAVLWAAWRAQIQLPHPELDLAGERDREFTGTVVSIPESADGRIQFDFEPDAGDGAPAPRRVRLTWYDAPATPRPAERWRFQMRLKPPRGFANPGGFDYEGQLFREGIDAVGYVRPSARNALVAKAAWRHPVLQVRAAVVERMKAVLSDSPVRGVAMGLAVGATDEIKTEQWRVFQATGITHLIAISGLHVTMIAALGMLLVRLLWKLPWRPRPRSCRADVAALAGALAAVGYALLAGLSVPTQRTLIMFLAALLALWLRRSQPPSHVLSVALVAVLLFDPHAALAPGFWLSFLCVGAILWVADRRRLRMGILGGIREFFTVQGAVTVALLPATLLWFGGISLVAPVVNIAAIPYFGCVLVPAILLGVCLLGIFPVGGEWLLRMSAASLEYGWPFLERAAEVPGGFVHLPSPTPLLAVTLAVTAVVLISPLPWRLRTLGALVLLPLFLTRPAGPPPGGLQLTVLDVGQGLSVFVRTGNHALLYDAGPGFRSGRSAGDLAVAPFLWHAGVRRLDRLVVSHPDDDHEGGVPAVMAAVDVSDVRFTAEAPPLPRRWAGVSRPCERGESWTWDGVRFEFLHPAAGERWKHNDGSCVLRISSAGGSVLLTGDIQRDAEGHLHRQGSLAPADIVLIPHHGSRTSSTPAFVDAARPRYAVASAGFLNRWNFPVPEVVKRWCDAGAQVPATAEWGAVTFDIHPQQGIGEPRAYRREYRRYWHAASAAAGRSLCLL